MLTEVGWAGVASSCPFADVVPGHALGPGSSIQQIWVNGRKDIEVGVPAAGGAFIHPAEEGYE